MKIIFKVIMQFI